MGRQASGEDGIRTRGRVLPLHRFSKPALSATQPPLRNPPVGPGAQGPRIMAALPSLCKTRFFLANAGSCGSPTGVGQDSNPVVSTVTGLESYPTAGYHNRSGRHATPDRGRHMRVDFYGLTFDTAQVTFHL